MPIITVAMFSGRTQREKDRFAEVITESAVKILGVLSFIIQFFIYKHARLS
jgi:phenylpyruvate tautomerase PptA (4-oxalocrotonate tautomerase family)